MKSTSSNTPCLYRFRPRFAAPGSRCARAITIRAHQVPSAPLFNPDTDPCYGAFCMAMGSTPREFNRAEAAWGRDPYESYIAWIQKMWAQWLEERGAQAKRQGPLTRAQFDVWLIDGGTRATSRPTA